MRMRSPITGLVGCEMARQRQGRTGLVRTAILAFALGGGLLNDQAAAQLQVPWFRGDLGLLAGSSPMPGVTAFAATTWYSANEVKDRDGNTFARGDLDIFVPFAAFTYTSSRKLLGAYWGGMLSVALANTALELPAVDVETGFGPGDLYIRPLNFGWHWPQADLTLAYALFIPTGRYVPDGTENTGLGLWSNEYDLGGTVFFDKERRWHFSTQASYQSGSAKADTRARPGSTITLYGGAGHAFKAGLANAGLAYYAQWKVSDDEFAIIPPALLAKHRIIGLGPELDWPIKALPTPLIATVRYFFEFDNRVATQGGTLYLGLTYVKPAAPPEAATNNGK